LSPLENLRFRIGLGGLRGGTAPGAALASVGLEGYEDVLVRRLSAGQRKRVALAALLISPATLWLLDEPYANLDRPGRVLVDRMLEAHILRGGGAIITSHGLIQPQVARVRYLKLTGASA
jgi:heme exporter protein A